MFNTLKKVMFSMLLMLAVASTSVWQSGNAALAAEGTPPPTPLAPGLSWNELGQSVRNIQLNIKGDTLELSGETFQAAQKFTGGVPKDVSDFYSNVELYKSGWSSDNAFEAADGVHRIFYHESGYYLAVEYLKCADDANSTCVTVWESAQKDTAKFIAGQHAEIGAEAAFVKKTPADGSTGLNPLSIYLSWSSYANTEKYSYCIKQDVECEMGDPNWTGTFLDRSITVSDLNPSRTYYWQVKAITCLDCTPKKYVLANNGDAWKFSTTTSAVKISGNAGVSGAILNYVDGGTRAIAADSNGDYAFLVSYNWTGTVIPTKSSYVFIPASRSYTNLVSNQTNQNYSAITGLIISGNVGVAGAVLSYVDGGTTKSVVSNSSGGYSLNVTYNWSGVVTPTKVGYTFSPSSRTYANVLSNTPFQGYNAIVLKYTITGKVGIGGAVLSYVDGTTKTVISDVNGNYSITVPYNWSGTVTPTRVGVVTFVPTSRTYVNVKANLSAQNYQANRVSTFVSMAAYDGWLLESSENSGWGGALNSTANIFAVGDDALNRQYRSILSFDTGILPDTAVILSAKLMITKQYTAGTDPMITHGPLVMDIKSQFFGAAQTLGLDDFNAVPGLIYAGDVGKIPVGNVYTGSLQQRSFPFISNTGLTQLRLRFQLDDNNDSSADYIAFYSGNAPIATFMPVLEITYYVP
jgi:hypothetical protein